MCVARLDGVRVREPEGWQSGLLRRGANPERPHMARRRFESSTLRLLEGHAAVAEWYSGRLSTGRSRVRFPPVALGGGAWT